MKLLEERIRKDGVVKEGQVLKVDSFINHQMDINLFNEMGKEFKRRLHVSLRNILMYRLYLRRRQKVSILMVRCILRK